MAAALRGDARTIQNSYELQNYTSIAHGKHFIKFGGRFRALTNSNSSNPNFNGTFIFSPVLDSNGALQNALYGISERAAQSVVTTALNPPLPAPTTPSCPTQFSITDGHAAGQGELV